MDKHMDQQVVRCETNSTNVAIFFQIQMKERQTCLCIGHTCLMRGMKRSLPMHNTLHW